MSNLERSYLEIKVTLLHIVILLVGVIIIGMFLFYLGYQAGKSSVETQNMQAQSMETGEKTREINFYDDKETPARIKTKPIKQVDKKRSQVEKKPSIDEEMKLHRQPVKKSSRKSSAPIKGKTVKRRSYYSVQVGAFSSFTNAKNYSEKFRKMGYQTEVISTLGGKKKLYRVRVGNFGTKAAADREKVKLEKIEKKKFAVKKSG